MPGPGMPADEIGSLGGKPGRPVGKSLLAAKGEPSPLVGLDDRSLES